MDMASFRGNNQFKAESSSDRRVRARNEGNGEGKTPRKQGSRSSATTATSWEVRKVHSEPGEFTLSCQACARAPESWAHRDN